MDQGFQSLRSLEIIKSKELTLLGPTTSIKTPTGKQFFYGPAYYYFSGLILSLNSSPQFYGYFLAGLILLTNYFLFKNHKTYLIFFLLNPLTLVFSNFIWNPNWLLLFVPLSLFSLINKRWFLAGLFLGLSLQFHYQIALLILFIFLKFCKQLPKIVPGFLIGYSPIILFELRNNFYNFRTILEYLSSPKTDNFIFQPYYFIFLIPFLSFLLAKLKTNYIFLLAYLPFYFLLYEKQTPSYSTWQKASQIILENQNKNNNFNVANLTYGDTQAWALRYLLYSKGLTSNPVNHYPQDQTLWVVSSPGKLISQKVWELNSFPSSPTAKYLLDHDLNLYYFSKN